MAGPALAQQLPSSLEKGPTSKGSLPSISCPCASFHFAWSNTQSHISVYMDVLGHVLHTDAQRLNTLLLVLPNFWFPSTFDRTGAKGNQQQARRLLCLADSMSNFRSRSPCGCGSKPCTPGEGGKWMFTPKWDRHRLRPTAMCLLCHRGIGMPRVPRLWFQSLWQWAPLPATETLPPPMEDAMAASVLSPWPGRC